MLLDNVGPTKPYMKCAFFLFFLWQCGGEVPMRLYNRALFFLDGTVLKERKNEKEKKRKRKRDKSNGGPR